MRAGNTQQTEAAGWNGHHAVDQILVNSLPERDIGAFPPSPGLEISLTSM